MAARNSSLSSNQERLADGGLPFDSANEYQPGNQGRRPSSGILTNEWGTPNASPRARPLSRIQRPLPAPRDVGGGSSTVKRSAAPERRHCERPRPFAHRRPRCANQQPLSPIASMPASGQQRSVGEPLFDHSVSATGSRAMADCGALGRDCAQADVFHPSRCIVQDSLSKHLTDATYSDPGQGFNYLN
jgi:hypothetical protein